jgi:hypothetical protein
MQPGKMQDGSAGYILLFPACAKAALCNPNCYLSPEKHFSTGDA